MISQDTEGSKLRKILTVLVTFLLLFIVPGSTTAQGSEWTDLAPAEGPSARLSHGMAYDSESDRIIIFGGESEIQGVRNNETWAYDFDANTWTNMNPTPGPSRRYAHAMAYDSESDRVVLFGGIPGSAETWVYDFNSNTWTNMGPAIQPTAWGFVEMAYDAGSDRIVLFGGAAAATRFPSQSAIRDETWAYDFNSNTWTNMNPSAAPSPRSSQGMAYVAQSDRILLFGGQDTAEIIGGTWAYDLNSNTWTEMSPRVTPSPRTASGMAYDAGTDRVVLFGGFPGLTETWVYDLNNNTWIQTDPASAPSLRVDTKMAYDAESKRIVLFGGCPALGCSGGDETWSHLLLAPPSPIPLWVFIVVGVVATAAVALIAVLAIRRSRGKREGDAQE